MMQYDTYGQQNVEQIQIVLAALSAQIDDKREKKVSRLQRQSGLRWPQATLSDFKGKKLPVSMPKTFFQAKLLRQDSQFQPEMKISGTILTLCGKTPNLHTLGQNLVKIQFFQVKKSQNFDFLGQNLLFFRSKKTALMMT